MTLAAHPSVHVMLLRNQLFEGQQMWRSTDNLCRTADDAWAKLLLDGECYLQLLGDNLPRLRELFADWVFEGKVTV